MGWFSFGETGRSTLRCLPVSFGAFRNVRFKVGGAGGGVTLLSAGGVGGGRRGVRLRKPFGMG